jgi:hypothetical protein
MKSTSESAAKARAAKKAREETDKAMQAEQTFHHLGYDCMPAIGRTGGVEAVGWELHCAGLPTLYFATKQQAIERATNDARRPKASGTPMPPWAH